MRAKSSLVKAGKPVQFPASTRLTCPHARCYPWPKNRRLEIATSSALGFMTTPPILRSPSGGHPGDSCGIRHQAVARRRIARRLRFLRTPPRDKERDDLPGVSFAFDAANRFSGAGMTDRSRRMLPGGRARGRSRLMVVDAVFGASLKRDPLPANACDARRFQPTDSRFSLLDANAEPSIAKTMLLETSPSSTS